MVRPPSIRNACSAAIAGFVAWNAGSLAGPVEARKPNVLLILTDDQGYGDLGFHGNKRIKTPRLDALARESARFGSYYVSPVCSPTRSSLMTGRYNYRTGVVDTFRGRSMMHSDEVTIAETLARSGYRTGIFGKWHLGDNYPLRAIDQGFQAAVVLRGGGIGQVSDPPGSSYFDPLLMHDGKLEAYKGYCSDVFADEAIRFIEADRVRPFFAYLAFNAPHDPLEVPEADSRPYLEDAHDVGTMPGEVAETTAKIYGMVSNIDRNVGRVLDRLDQLGLARDTIVLFMTDNGPAQMRYVAGLRGRKGTVFEGGIKVPCFVRWPGTLEAGRVVETVAAHIDIMPTLLDACGVEKPAGVAFDGRSFLPLLKGESVDWPERALYFQWHRADVPEFHRAFAARGPRFKLVQPLGVEPNPLPATPQYSLFDMAADPFEKKDLAGQHPEVVASMLKGYEDWFRDVESTRHFQPPRIRLGSPSEDPATLTRQDWRGNATAWEPGGLGGWGVEVVEKARFDMTLLFVYGPPGLARISLGGMEAKAEVGPNSRTCRIEGVELPPGPGTLRAWVDRPSGGVAAFQVELRRRDGAAGSLKNAPPIGR